MKVIGENCNRHVMGMKQEHSALLGQLAELCATAVAEYESTLAQQEEADSAAAKRRRRSKWKWQDKRQRRRRRRRRRS